MLSSIAKKTLLVVVKLRIAKMAKVKHHLESNELLAWTKTILCAIIREDTLVFPFALGATRL